ncbi:MAG TPA: SRPBCC domain-containing protein [Steroidobacteraceae bacterium]|nr:SRPBCC domain-containing protein [Steroidobacteraceae bacterium]
MALKFEVYGKVARPVGVVFDAVTNPKELSSYFTTGGASAPLAEGATVTWDFADFPGAFPVKVTRVVPNERIELSWESAEHGYDTQVVMTFEAVDANTTLVRIAESGWRDTPKGRESSYGNCSGWMQMLCCLKAWVEHRVNLRQGFF